MTLMAAGAAHAVPPAGPPGQAPNEVVVTNFPATQNVTVTNLPASQDVTINHEVDVNISNSRRIQISIVGESSSDGGPVTGVIQRAGPGPSPITVSRPLIESGAPYSLAPARWKNRARP